MWKGCTRYCFSYLSVYIVWGHGCIIQLDITVFWKMTSCGISQNKRLDLSFLLAGECTSPVDRIFGSLLPDSWQRDQLWTSAELAGVGQSRAPAPCSWWRQLSHKYSCCCCSIFSQEIHSSGWGWDFVWGKNHTVAYNGSPSVHAYFMRLFCINAYKADNGSYPCIIYFYSFTRIAAQPSLSYHWHGNLLKFIPLYILHTFYISFIAFMQYAHLIPLILQSVWFWSVYCMIYL
jgi:hypothetical protein